jgi:hypothetical protein
MYFKSICFRVYAIEDIGNDNRQMYTFIDDKMNAEYHLSKGYIELICDFLVTIINYSL